MNKIRTEDAYEDFITNKDIFDFSNHLGKLKFYDDSMNLIVGKIKN